MRDGGWGFHSNARPPTAANRPREWRTSTWPVTWNRQVRRMGRLWCGMVTSGHMIGGRADAGQAEPGKGHNLWASTVTRNGGCVSIDAKRL